MKPIVKLQVGILLLFTTFTVTACQGSRNESFKLVTTFTGEGRYASYERAFLSGLDYFLETEDHNFSLSKTTINPEKLSELSVTNQQSAVVGTFINPLEYHESLSKNTLPIITPFAPGVKVVPTLDQSLYRLNNDEQSEPPFLINALENSDELSNPLVIVSRDPYYDELYATIKDDYPLLPMYKVMDNLLTWSGVLSLVNLNNYDSLILLLSPFDFTSLLYNLVAEKHSLVIFTLSQNLIGTFYPPAYNEKKLPIFTANPEYSLLYDFDQFALTKDYFKETLSESDQALITNYYLYVRYGYLSAALLKSALLEMDQLEFTYEQLNEIIKEQENFIPKSYSLTEFTLPSNR